MTTVPGIRLLGGPDLPLTGSSPSSPGAGYTVEAWVRPAYHDRAVRLYAAPDFAGPSQRFTAGTHPSLGGQLRVDSIEVPEGMRVVLFAEPGLIGACIPFTADAHDLSRGLDTFGSMVVIDQTQRRQDAVVLFSSTSFEEPASVLTLPDSWWANPASEVGASSGPRGLVQVASAWVPPGVALDSTEHLFFSAEDQVTTPEVRPFPDLPDGVSESAALGLRGDVTWLLFEGSGYAGRCQVGSSTTAPDWPVRSAVAVAVSGIVHCVLGICPARLTGANPVVRLFQGGQQLPSDALRWLFWVPRDVCLVPYDTSEPDILGAGVQTLMSSTPYVVERAEWPSVEENSLRLEGMRIAVDPSAPPWVRTVERDADVGLLPRDEVDRRSGWVLFDATKLEAGEVANYSTVAIGAGVVGVLSLGPLATTVHQENYVLLPPGTYDLSRQVWDNAALTFVRSAHGIDGVVVFTDTGARVVGENQAIQDIVLRDVWVPPTFQVRRVRSTWRAGLHRAAGVALHTAIRISRSTLVGDQAELSSNVVGLSSRRDATTVVDRFDPAHRPANRSVPIVADRAGGGLSVVDGPGSSRGGRRELRFGGRLLRPGHWHHLAQSQDPVTGVVTDYLDGRPVGQPGRPVTSLPIALGAGFRGSVAQVRMWPRALSGPEVAQFRFPGAADGEPTVELLSPTERGQSVVVDADLPTRPVDTMLVQRGLQRLAGERQQALVGARAQGSEHRRRARAQADRTLARAREEARRQVHLSGLDRVTWTLADVVHTARVAGKTFDGRWDGSRPLDLHLIGSQLFSAGATGVVQWLDLDTSTWDRALMLLDRRPGPLAGVATKLTPAAPLHPPDDSDPEQTLTYLFWLAVDGTLGRHRLVRGQIDSSLWYLEAGVPETKLTDGPVPGGRERYFDLAFDPVSHGLVWTNGMAIYQLDDPADRYENRPVPYRVLYPHAKSPHPAAPCVTPDGALVWVDVEDEVIRTLSATDRDAIFHDGRAVATDLYAAPRPASVLATTTLDPDGEGGAPPATFVYWVAAERRTLDVPVLDLPGRFLDLHDGSDADPQHGQRVSAVAVQEVWGTSWTAVGSAPRSLVFPPSGSRAGSVGFEPVRLDLSQGLTVSADLTLSGMIYVDLDSLLYELATLEYDDRVVCYLNGEGSPRIYLRWGGRDLVAGGSETAVGELMPPRDEVTRFTWLIDPAGAVSTYIGDEQAWQQPLTWRPEVRVFETHQLGAAATRAPHRTMLDFTRDPWENVGPSRMGPFRGSLTRFAAWNTAVPGAATRVGDDPAGAAGSDDLPAPNARWSRNLVTVESRRRYLHAGRVDGLEPALALFPIDLDAGLNVESTLDAGHAALTLAHARLAATQAQGSQLRQAAEDSARQRLAAAVADLAAVRAQADREISAANERVADAQAAARASIAQANASAQVTRSEAADRRDQTVANGKRDADDQLRRTDQATSERVARARARRDAARR